VVVPLGACELPLLGPRDSRATLTMLQPCCPEDETIDECDGNGLLALPTVVRIRRCSFGLPFEDVPSCARCLAVILFPARASAGRGVPGFSPRSPNSHHTELKRTRLPRWKIYPLSTTLHACPSNNYLW
jgi:hypothetical protein